tara:strand:- start:2 stop:268 length:267 start_codon:yes stop_codon:yes gene_type:complete
MSGFEIVKAIRKINPNAKVIVRGSNIDTCEIEWIEGTEISKSDIKSKLIIVEQEIIDAEANVITKKASAKAKLKALGLDDEELKNLGL